jgi:hypothetical protein
MLNEYKLIPNLFPYAVSNTGVVINTESNRILKAHIIKKGKSWNHLTHVI